MVHSPLLYPDTSIGTDIQNMTAALSKIAFNVCLELVKHIHGNKCLNSSGKSTAMYTVCTSAIQQSIAKSQCKANGLVLNSSWGTNVLQIHSNPSDGTVRWTVLRRLDDADTIM